MLTEDYAYKLKEELKRTLNRITSLQMETIKINKETKILVRISYVLNGLTFGLIIYQILSGT